MTTENSSQSEWQLGVVIPVKLIDGEALSTLTSIAESAPALRFVAVGEVQAPKLSLPCNLQILDKDCSIYEAMNEGTRELNTDYLLFMGIDDELLAANADRIIAHLHEVGDASLVVLPFMVGRRLVRQKATSCRRRSFHHQGVLFARQKVMQLGGYSTQYRLHSDLDLMFRIQSCGTVASIDWPLVNFSTSGLTTSGRHASVSIVEFWRIYRANRIRRWSAQFAISVSIAAWYGLRYVWRSSLNSTRRTTRGSSQGGAA